MCACVKPLQIPHHAAELTLPSTMKTQPISAAEITHLGATKRLVSGKERRRQEKWRGCEGFGGREKVERGKK